MKKSLLILLALMLMLSLTACGGTSSNPPAMAPSASEGPAAQEVTGIDVPAFKVFINGIEITHQAMAAYPLYSVDATSTNTYGTETTINYVGYSIADVLKAAELEEDYLWLQGVASDGYTITLSDDMVLDKTTLLAITQDGAPFPHSPWLAPCRSKVTPDYLRAVDYILVNTTAGPPDIAAPSGDDTDVSRVENHDETEPRPAVSATDDSDTVVLTITGDGVSGETTWTLARLKTLTDGYREITYSTTNNWPTRGHITAHGVSLPHLLRQAGILDSAASFKLKALDGYQAVITREQMFGEMYSYTNHSASGSSGQVVAEPLVSWAWSENGKVQPENLRTFFGQRGPMDVNTSCSIKDIYLIEVSTESAGTWAPPEASLADGSAVSAGTEFELTHTSLDSVRLYYTLDGNEPGYNSPVYNPSTKYYQPDLIKPLVLTESITIKAFAAGFGKDKSPVATFRINVK